MLLATLLSFWSGFVFAQRQFQIGVKGSGINSDGENAFWTTANQNGLLGSTTTALGEVFVRGEVNLDLNTAIYGGASFFYAYSPGEEDHKAVDQYYAGLQWKKLEVQLGAQRRPENYLGLSSTNGDILWSNNARAIPGVLVQTAAPVRLSKRITLEGVIANYWLTDDRFVKDAMMHYKEGKLNWTLGQRGVLHLGLKHYAQWGGTSPVRGEQPSGLSDFFRVFVGTEGGSNAIDIDQMNGLGNHLGSYLLGYTHKFSGQTLDLYHQTLFEDSSGQEGKTFPDGLWGAFLKFENTSFFRGLLYEYTQTTWQSGQFRRLGGDNYFFNTTYRSGYTFQGNIIGTPFILPDPENPGVSNNVVNAHHLGVRALAGGLDMTLKATWAHNQGTFAVPYDPSEKVLYSFLGLGYDVGGMGHLQLDMGMDLSDLQEDRFTVQLGYRWQYSSGRQ